MTSNDDKKDGDEIAENPSNQETLESIETALGGIEAQLRPSLVRQSGGRSVHNVAAAGMNAVGRSVRESIRSALGSLRSRLDTVEEGQPRRLSAADTATMNGLSERLRNAERAHSNRIPLDVLQRELSRRQSVNTAEFTQKEETDQQSRASTRRRSSVLLASRRMAAAAEGHQADMDLHGASMQTLSPVKTIEETREEEDEVMQKEAVEEIRDHEHDEHELPILLTQTSFSRLDPARRSVLFGESEQRFSQPAVTSATLVYSWSTLR